MMMRTIKALVMVCVLAGAVVVSCSDAPEVHQGTSGAGGAGGIGGAGGAPTSSVSSTATSTTSSHWPVSSAHASTGTVGPCDPAIKPKPSPCLFIQCENGVWAKYTLPEKTPCGSPVDDPYSECDAVGECTPTPPPGCKPIVTKPSSDPGCSGGLAGCHDGNPCTTDFCANEADNICAHHYPLVDGANCPGISPPGCPGMQGCPACMHGWCCDAP